MYLSTPPSFSHFKGKLSNLLRKGSPLIFHLGRRVYGLETGESKFRQTLVLWLFSGFETHKVKVSCPRGVSFRQNGILVFPYLDVNLCAVFFK